MAEQEVVEKCLEELKNLHVESIDRLKEGALEQLAQVKEHYEDKIRELDTQNAGLLGAVGRLHVENQQLEDKVRKLDEMRREEKVELTIRLRDMQSEHQSELQECHTQIEKLEAELKAKKG